MDEIKESCKITVSNLFPNVKLCDLCDAFKVFGKFESVNITCDKQGNIIGSITFEEKANAIEAVKRMNLAKTSLGKPLFVTFKNNNYKPRDKQTLIYVGNFKDLIDEADLELLFDPFGIITSSSIKRENGKSKGFGFIDFKCHEDAKKAVEEMNGEICKGRKLIVSFAENREDREKQLKIEKGLLGSSNADLKFAEQSLKHNTDYCNLHVANLPAYYTDEMLHALFRSYGCIVSAKVECYGNKKSKGFGFVSFQHEAEARKAVKDMNGFKLGTESLKISFKQNKEQRQEYLALKRLNKIKSISENKARVYKSGKLYLSEADIFERSEQRNLPFTFTAKNKSCSKQKDYQSHSNPVKKNNVVKYKQSKLQIKEGDRFN